MTEAQAIEAISALVVAQWPAVTSGLPLALEDEAMLSADSFGQLTIRHTTARQITMGNTGVRRVERKGNIYLKIWGPVDAGRAGTSGIADAVRGFLEMVNIAVVGQVEPLTTYAGYTQEAGSDSRWYMTVVIVPFVYYQTK